MTCSDRNNWYPQREDKSVPGAGRNNKFPLRFPGFCVLPSHPRKPACRYIQKGKSRVFVHNGPYPNNREWQRFPLQVPALFPYSCRQAHRSRYPASARSGLFRPGIPENRGIGRIGICGIKTVEAAVFKMDCGLGGIFHPDPSW